MECEEVVHPCRSEVRFCCQSCEGKRFLDFGDYVIPTSLRVKPLQQSPHRLASWLLVVLFELLDNLNYPLRDSWHEISCRPRLAGEDDGPAPSQVRRG